MGIRSTVLIRYGVRGVSNDPKYQELRNRELQINVAQDYGPFLAKARLTPGQTAKLMQALTQREIDKEDLGWTLRSQGLALDDPSGAVIKQQSDDALRQAVEDALGPDAYAQFDAYDRQKTIWDKMGDFAAKSTRLGSPITSGQVGQVIDYIAQNNPDYQEGKAVNGGQIDWPAVNDYARTILTPDQLDLFTTITADYAARQKVNRALAAIGEAGGAGNGGAENAGGAASR